MDTLTKGAAWVGLLLALVVSATLLFGGGGLGGSVIEHQQTDFVNGLRVAGDLVFDGTSGQPVVTVGDNGTALANVKTGSCTIWAPANTIAATSSQQVECQGATNGSLSASLTGITTDSTCYLKMASSTNTTLGTILIGGASPTSTATVSAGSLVARIVNLTGTTYTWSAAASSSAQWQYTCFDPS